MGNSIANATQLTLNTSLQSLNDSATISAPDFFRINVTQRTSLSLRASSLTGTGVDMAIVDSQGNQIRDLTGRNTGLLAETINTVLNPGTYYIQVAGVDSTNSSYTLGYAGNSAFNDEIIWKNNGSPGDVAYWKMNGATWTGQVGSLQNLNDPTWQIRATGDFNSDGRSDLVFQNTVSGQVALWYLSNNGLMFSDVLATSGGSFTVKGAGDFNGDGHTDLLFNEVSSGATAIWYFDGSRRIDPIATELSGSAPGWEVQAVADFNNDGKADIFWRQKSGNGDLAVWYMDSAKLTSSALLTDLGVSDQQWNVVGSGDFNKDGKADLLWRYGVTGGLYSWQMDNTTRLSTSTIQTTSDLNWSPLAGFKRVSETDTIGGTPGTAFNIGTISSNGSFGSYRSIVGTANTADVYRFTVGSTQNVSFSIDSPSGQRVQLRLLNSSGTQIGISTNASSLDALLNNSGISQSLAAGDYFVEVTTLETTQDGIGYTLNINKDWMNVFNFQTNQVTNTLNVSRTTPGSDFYRIDLSSRGVLTLNLTGLSADADIRLIHQKDLDSAIETGEVINLKWERGNQSETLRTFLEQGQYFVNVFNAPVNTSYNLAGTFQAATIDSQKQYIKLGFDPSILNVSSTARTEMMKQAKYWESAISEKTAITGSNIHAITVNGANLGGSNVLAVATRQLQLNSSGVNNLKILNGTITFNTNTDWNNLDLFQRTFKHEIAHTLGFGTIWEPITFSNGQTVGFNLVNRSNATYSASTYAGWAYAALIGSNSPVVVPLEGGSDPLSAFSHWSEAVFDRELMTPFTDPGGMPLSALSLASLRDLGWSINMGAAEAYTI